MELKLSSSCCCWCWTVGVTPQDGSDRKEPDAVTDAEDEVEVMVRGLGLTRVNPKVKSAKKRNPAIGLNGSGSVKTELLRCFMELKLSSSCCCWTVVGVNPRMVPTAKEPNAATDAEDEVDNAPAVEQEEGKARES